MRDLPAAAGGGARPGFGVPHPELVALLSTLKPAATDRVVWGSGVVLDVAAYPVWTPLPTVLVTSVRCIVRVGGAVVVCRVPGGLHPWPGGRREPGESYEETARREVYEETGWLLDEGSLRPLGFLHYRHVEPPPAGHPYPHPDFLQVVFTGVAGERAGGAAEWVDLDGWEQGSWLVDVKELEKLGFSPTQWVFLRAATATGTEGGDVSGLRRSPDRHGPPG